MIYERSSFERSFKRLSADDQVRVRAVIAQLASAFGFPHRHAGLGLRPFGRYYECRVGRGLRILFLIESGDFFLVLVGDHDDLRQHIRSAG